MRKETILRILLLTVLCIFIGCKNKSDDSEEQTERVWDKDKISIANNSNESYFEEISDSGIYTRAAGTTGIIGEWTRSSSSTTVYLPKLKIQKTFYPLTKKVIYNANGTYTASETRTWKEGNGLSSQTSTSNGIYSLYILNDVYMIETTDDKAHVTDKYSYIVSDKHLKVTSISE